MSTNCCRTGWVAVLFCLPALVPLPAQTFATLVNFDGSNGAGPEGALVQGLDGNFYGMTSAGGANGYGTIFRASPEGVLTTLHSFDLTHGGYPSAGLLLTPEGFFYGTTLEGGPTYSGCGTGTHTCGTIFQFTPAGALTTLYLFGPRGGRNPAAALIQAAAGDLYGTTESGGEPIPDGTVFKLGPGGALTTVHKFNGINGASPVSPLIQAANGNFYGVTLYGGEPPPACSCGNIFQITPAGTLSTLAYFYRGNGAYPSGGLVQATDGNFYGTTTNGPPPLYGGTVFKITAGGTLTTLHVFGGTDGAGPQSGVIQATDGNFYGTSDEGGAGDFGTIFEMTPAGTLTVLHSFSSSDGASPVGPLLQGTDGNFYGATYAGGTSNNGTIFRLSVGLGPFVRTLPALGKVGATVKILGTSLAGATSVTFNGTPAAVTSVSDTVITTAVPAGATSGTVVVSTPGGGLSSNVAFRVVP